MTPAPQFSFWSAAAPTCQIWRSVLGFILIHVVFFAATFAIFMGGAWLIDKDPATILEGATATHTAIFFLTFLGYHLGLWLVVRFLHKRSYWTLFGPQKHVLWRQFRIGILIALGVALAAGLLQTVEPLFVAPQDQTQLERNLPTDEWMLVLVPALILIFIQIFAEELVFRGYMLQQLRARFQSVWIWAILPSVAFGLLHADPSTWGINAVFYVIHTSVVGIVLSFVTIRTGNIGAAAGLHFGNNMSMVLMGNKGSLDGFSLFVAEVDLKGWTTSASMMLQTVLVLIAFAIWWKLTQGQAPIANASKAD
ncbi:CPBP family intramembrane glutamic endopeptidase [uncultured Aliiroseovarius sp.]|uniref:CPBP family intramembrane glutamic endopeptidase n=1 Tax=uncultured Aliiroseovarius sp. TaxID=1658783 RepID=UPI002617F248|nr:CPBP family intramembrane glutamic endopeptidase [uncultured Aliiroseovarius sp.]